MADRRVIVPETKETVYHLPTILQNATELKASDIHIEPGQTSFRIRIRIDGRMQISDEGPMTEHVPLINRLKILCGMDITEKRIPQDGGFTEHFDGHPVDFRVSVVPVADGEKAAIRILDDRAIDLDYQSLGICKSTGKDWCILSKQNTVCSFSRDRQVQVRQRPCIPCSKD